MIFIYFTAFLLKNVQRDFSAFIESTKSKLDPIPFLLNSTERQGNREAERDSTRVGCTPTVINVKSLDQ